MHPCVGQQRPQQTLSYTGSFYYAMVQQVSQLPQTLRLAYGDVTDVQTLTLTTSGFFPAALLSLSVLTVPSSLLTMKGQNAKTPQMCPSLICKFKCAKVHIQAISGRINHRTLQQI